MEPAPYRISYNDLLNYSQRLEISTPPSQEAFTYVLNKAETHFPSDVYDDMIKLFLMAGPEVEEAFRERHDALGLHQEYPASCDNRGVPPSEALAADHSSSMLGGAYAGTRKFNMTRWLTDLLLQPMMGGSTVDPVPSILGGLAVSQILGVLSTVGAIAMEIVPPKIPPPFWLLRPMPCMPQVLGKNCLGSVLYPIALPEFIMAPFSDQGMEIYMESFPRKYAMQIGKTSKAKYDLCARVYLGLQCAKLFPMCFIVVGQTARSSFPVCFPLCILTLLACPGFTMKDIMPACSQLSLPPFCAFSIYVKNDYPPQLSDFEDENPTPSGAAACPQEGSSSADKSYSPGSESHLGDSIKEALREIDESRSTSEPLPIGELSVTELSQENSVKVIREIVIPRCDCSKRCAGGEIKDHWVREWVRENCPPCHCPRDSFTRHSDVGVDAKLVDSWLESLQPYLDH